MLHDFFLVIDYFVFVVGVSSTSRNQTVDTAVDLLMKTIIIGRGCMYGEHFVKCIINDKFFKKNSAAQI